MSEIDYFIGDKDLLPIESHKHFVEKVGILNRGYLAFTPPDQSPNVSFNADMFNANEHTIYCSFNNPRKITSETLVCWKEILELDKSSKLVLKGHAYSDIGFKSEFMNLLSSYKFDLEQVIILSHTKTISDHLNTYNGVHCSLDTIGFTGGTTTCEALWMGVPVVTLPGIEMKTRISTSCIISAGCQEMIAANKDEYIRIAHETGLSYKRNPAQKMQLHEKVKHSDLLDGDSLAEALLEFAKGAVSDR